MSNEECIAPFFYGMEEQSPDTFCGAWFGSFENMIVRKNSTVTATICKGDSGGPLVIPGTMMDVFNFQGDVQIGIVSAGPPCPYLPPEGVVVWPAEYVDVSRYVDWIHEEMRKRGLTPLPVATSPLKRAYRDQTCYPGNCYDQDLMAGVGNNAPKAVTSGGSRSVARGGMAAAVAAVTLTVVIKFL
jgi:secreted trypsin-like serine protease